MPEIWIPYGPVETLVTIQAENLGDVVDAPPEKGALDIDRLTELVKGSSSLFVCDSSPPTMEVLKPVASAIVEGSLKVYSAAPKKAELTIPELKGRVTTLPPPIIAQKSEGPLLAQELTEGGKKLFLGTARPDPMYGLLDASAEACMSWVAGWRAQAVRARKTMEPAPFEKTHAYEEMKKVADGIAGAVFLDVIPRGGAPKAVLEDAPFDALKNGFLDSEASQAKGLIVGAGGVGFDDSLSAALRLVWGALPSLRKSGTLLLMAECSEGLGSTALEMLATGRVSADAKRKDYYVDGLEEVFYLEKLKEEYDVMLLSGLPEVYAGSRLGLTTAKGAGEAVGRVLNRIGKTGRLNIVTRASDVRVKSA